MRRILLFLTLGLSALVVTDRVSKTFGTARESIGATVPIPGSVTGGSDVLSLPRRSMRSAIDSAPAASTVDRLARLAVRQRLSRLATGTYLDSLVMTTDSVLRRWPDRPGTPLRVAVTEGGASGYHPRMATLVQEAFRRWDEAHVGVTFLPALDTATADIKVRWIDRFAIERAGQTDLTWDQTGRVRRAAISLAIRTNAGFQLPDAAMLAVAVHEVGHAIGLPHSADSNDVMYPATRTGILSERDQKTALTLYRFPPGPLRDAAPNAR